MAWNTSDTEPKYDLRQDVFQLRNELITAPDSKTGRITGAGERKAGRCMKSVASV